MVWPSNEKVSVRDHFRDQAAASQCIAGKANFQPVTQSTRRKRQQIRAHPRDRNASANLAAVRNFWHNFVYMHFATIGKSTLRPRWRVLWLVCLVFCFHP